MRRVLPVLIGLLMLSPAALSEQFYKWKDENGVWHYSAKAPKDQPVDKLKVRAASARDAKQSDQAEDEADPDSATASKGTSAQSPNCLASLANLEILNTNQQVSKDIDGDGEAETLTLEQHKEEIAMAEQQKAAFCKPEKPVAEENEEATE